MTPDTRRTVLLTALALIPTIALSVTIAVLAMRSCSAPSIAVGIDAGPGDREIAARLDGAVMEQQRRIERLEAQHAEEIAAFESAERAEYERVRAEGDRKRLARWFRERSRRLLWDGGARDAP